MKIVIIGESPTVPSGFGQQTYLLAKGLASRGHEVTCLAANSVGGDLPEGVEEWRISNPGDVPAIDRAVEKLRPDAVIVFWFVQMFLVVNRMRSAPANCPVYYWPAWEGSTLPNFAQAVFAGVPPGRVVHLSEFARKLWGEATRSEVVIPHGIDLSVFYSPDVASVGSFDRSGFRRKWAERLRFPLFDDSIVVLNVDRNVHHKRWDLTFDFVRRLQEHVDRRVQLIAHSQMQSYVGWGDRQPRPELDLVKLSQTYGVERQTVFTDFGWDRGLTPTELRELYWLSDLRISTSEGEGFGLPTVECAACGTPQVVNSHTTMPEVLPPGSEFLVAPAASKFGRGESLWQEPDVAAMVRRAEAFLEDSFKELGNEIESARVWVKQFSTEKVLSAWDALLTNPRTDDHWHESRWGYQARFETMKALRDLAVLLSKLLPGGKVLEIGSFDGIFLDYAAEVGLDVAGIEPDSAAVARCSSRAHACTREQAFASAWLGAGAVVATDVFDLLLGAVDGSRSEFLTAALDVLAGYEWAFLRFEPCYRWDVPRADVDFCKARLEERGIFRRRDLEDLAREKIAPALDHEIWWRQQDASVVPKQLVT